MTMILIFDFQTVLNIFYFKILNYLDHLFYIVNLNITNFL